MVKVLWNVLFWVSGAMTLGGLVYGAIHVFAPGTDLPLALGFLVMALALRMSCGPELMHVRQLAGELTITATVLVAMCMARWLLPPFVSVLPILAAVAFIWWRRKRFLRLLEPKRSPQD